MSVQTQIERLNAVKNKIRTNLVAQGVTVPSDATLDEMAEQILSVAGYTPVRGTDYWTELDRASIITEVIESVIVQYPESHVIYGDVDQGKIITLYSADKLPVGTYTMNYKMDDGSLQPVGQLVISGEVVVEPVAVNLRWVTEAGINQSTGKINGAAHVAMTDFVFMEPGAKFAIKMTGLNSNQKIYTRCYDSTFTYIGGAEITKSTAWSDIVFPDGTTMFRLHCSDESNSTNLSAFTTGISITATKLSSVTAIPFTVTNDIKLDKTTGAESTDTGYAASNFVEVDDAATYKLYAMGTVESTVSVNCFDATKKQIGYLANIVDTSRADPELVDIALPAGTAYIRLRIYDSSTVGLNATSAHYNISVIKYSVG